MNFQSSCKIITNQSLRHYSYESMTLQIGPSLSSNSCAKSLTGFKAEEAIGGSRRWPEEACRRRWSGGGPLGVPHAPAGGLGWPRGGPRWTGHAHRRSEVTAAGDYGAPSVVLDGEHEHGVQAREAKLVALLMRSEGGLRGENSRGTGELGARPWRSRVPARSGARRGQRE